MPKENMDDTITKAQRAVEEKIIQSIRRKISTSCSDICGDVYIKDYLVHFFEICDVNKIKFPGLDTFPCALCLMLDSGNEAICKILPYMLLSYIYNSQPEKGSRNEYLFSFAERPEVKQIFQDEIFWGYREPGRTEKSKWKKLMEELHYPSKLERGIGHLFWGDDSIVEEEEENHYAMAVIERQAKRFILMPDEVRPLVSLFNEDCYLIPTDEKSTVNAKFDRKIHNLRPVKATSVFNTAKGRIYQVKEKYSVLYDVNLLQDIFVAWYQAITQTLTGKTDTQPAPPDELLCAQKFHSLFHGEWAYSHSYMMEELREILFDTPTQSDKEKRSQIRELWTNYCFWSNTDSSNEQISFTTKSGENNFEVLPPTIADKEILKQLGIPGKTLLTFVCSDGSEQTYLTSAEIEDIATLDLQSLHKLVAEPNLNVEPDA